MANKKSIKYNKNAVKALEKENLKLRKEIARLNNIISSSSAEIQTPEKFKGKDASEKLFNHRQLDASSICAVSYPRYLKNKLSFASTSAAISKAFGMFRRFRFISTSISIINYILAIIGTGAFFIFLSGISLFLIPFIFVFAGSIYVASTFFRKRDFANLNSAVQGKKIFVLFPSKERSFDKDSFFSKSIADAADNMKEDHFIIIVSPYFCSSKGFIEKQYYPILRYESQNICIIRRYAYFAMKRKILGPISKKVSYIH